MSADWGTSVTSVDAARYRLGDDGQVFATRAKAKKLREKIEQLAAGSPSMVFDFDGVKSISFSFGDELFGVLAERHVQGGDRVLPIAIGLTAQVQRVLLGSLEQRGIPDDVRLKLVPH